MGFMRPRVDGGMTMDEMRQMRMEDRAYMEQQQTRQMDMMREFELEREEQRAARAAAEEERERRTLTELEAAEDVAIEQARKIAKEDEEDEEFTPFSLSVSEMRPE